MAALDRARVRALALAVACDIHPLNNLRVLNYLTGPLEASDAQRTAWIHHWMALGLEAIDRESALAQAESDLAQAVAAENIALLNLSVARGGVVRWK